MGEEVPESPEDVPESPEDVPRSLSLGERFSSVSVDWWATLVAGVPARFIRRL